MSPMAGCLGLAAEGASAQIALRGGELRRWQVGGRELLWAPDPAVWSETAPILFPVVGWTHGGRVRIGSETYPLGLHGFARTLDFAVARRDGASATLVLASGAATRPLYPFEFMLELSYRLTPDALAVDLAVTNRSPGPMPYACGLHPGFRWPFAGGAQTDYRILFDAPEQSCVPVITRAGLFTAATRPVPVQDRALALAPALFAAEALCFLHAASRGLRFEAPGGSALCLETENFPHLALWSRSDGRFLAIEAWTGHGDPDGYEGDLFDKPSMILLPPGGQGTHRALFRFEPGPRA